MSHLMTAEEIEQMFTEKWGRQAYLNPYRIWGNRTVYAISDHGRHWVSVDTCWVDGQQRFSPR